MSKRLRIGKKTSWPALIIVLIFALSQHYGWFEAAKNSMPQIQGAVTQSQPGFYRITKFHDGDTVTVDMNGKPETIRLIGVDTPETHDPRKPVQCFGKAASDYTRELIGANQIRLEADPLNTNRDRYDRLLRYAYLPDGRLINSEIIKSGYGFAYVSFPFSKIDEFKTLQATAQSERKGLWNACQPTKNDNGNHTSNAAQS